MEYITAAQAAEKWGVSLGVTLLELYTGISKTE